MEKDSEILEYPFAKGLIFSG